MEQVMALCRFVKYTIQQYLPLIKDLSDEELHQLILTLITPISMSGSKYVNLKVMSTDNHLTCTSALWLAINLCEKLNKEIETLENVGENYFKSVKLLANLTSFLRGIQIKITHQPTKTMA